MSYIHHKHHVRKLAPPLKVLQKYIKKMNLQIFCEIFFIFVGQNFRKGMDFRIIGVANSRCRIARRVGIIATTLSVAVVVVSAMVSSGFRGAIERKAVELMDFGHIRAGSSLLWGSGSEMLSAGDVERVNSVIYPEVLAQVVEGQGVLLSGANLVPTIIKGEEFGGVAVGGVILSKSAARELGVGVGDVVEVMGGGVAQQFARVRVDSIYSSGIVDIEGGVCFMSESMARQFSALDSTQVSYYAVKGEVDDLEALEVFVAGERMTFEGIEQRAGSIFGWLDMIDNNVMLVLVIMVVVALINIVTTTLIIMLDNTERVATLRALGMSRGSVRRLFLLSIGRFMWRGVFYGVLIGVSLAMVQSVWGVLSLDEASYLLDRVPVAFDVEMILLYSVVMLATVVVSIIIPVSIVSRLSIARALKYQ